MFFLNILRRIRSYNIVKVQTAVPEKILNLLQMNRIAVWDITYNDEKGYLCFKVVNRDIDYANQVVARFGSNIEIIKRLGFERALLILKTRKIFFIFAFICMSAIILFSQFIWKIEINGTRETDASDIRLFLYNSKIRQSEWKHHIDTNEVEVAILKEFTEISDVSVDISGTKLIITVVERESPIALYDKKIPVNLVAVEDGIINEMIVYNGTALVKVGDSVKKGDILISGTVNYKFKDEEQVSYIHAMGKILTYKNEEIGDIIINRYKPVDESVYETEKTIYLFGMAITLNKNKESENYMYIEEKNKVLKLGWIELPILCDEKKWYNINNCVMKTDEEISTEIHDIVSKQLSGKCTILNLTYSVQPLDFYQINVYSNVKCAYNLAIEEKIPQ